MSGPSLLSPSLVPNRSFGQVMSSSASSHVAESVAPSSSASESDDASSEVIESVAPSSPVAKSVASPSSLASESVESFSQVTESVARSPSAFSQQGSAESEASSDDNEVWEICCNPQSTLTRAARARGLKAKRLTLETGYDIMKKATVRRVCKQMKKKKPRRAWASIPCTPWSAMQNFNQKPSQRTALNRARKESRVLLRNALQILKSMVGVRRHVYFEWPTRCQGWLLPELVAFRRHCIAKGCPVYKVRIDGCMYRLKSEQRPGTYLKKAWTILTTDPTFGSACGRCCQGRTHLHTVIMGKDTTYSGFYPRAMGKAIARHWDPLAHL